MEYWPLAAVMTGCGDLCRVAGWQLTLCHPIWQVTSRSYEGKGKGKAGIAVHGTPSHSYGVSLAIWDHTVLPSTQHK